MDPSPAEPGRRDRKKQQTRAAILSSALSLFREHGIYATRIADITTLADVGKGVFYNYFDSKEDIVAELVRGALDLLEEEFTTIPPASPATERVDRLARIHEEFFEKHPEYALLIHQGRGLLFSGRTSIRGLQTVFHDYLVRLSGWLVPEPEREAWDEAVLLDLAAAVAGHVAGYRSFRLAAGLPIDVSTIGETLSLGVPVVLEKRRRPLA